MGALAKAVSFLSYFNDPEDPHRRGEVPHPLGELPPPAPIAVPAGAEGFTGIAPFGRRKLAFPRRFRPRGTGTPPHDRIGALFASLDTGCLGWSDGLAALLCQPA